MFNTLQTQHPRKCWKYEFYVLKTSQCLSDRQRLFKNFKTFLEWRQNMMYGSEQRIPSAVLLLNSLALPSTYDGSALKVLDVVLCLHRLYSPSWLHKLKVTVVNGRHPAPWIPLVYLPFHVSISYLQSLTYTVILWLHWSNKTGTQVSTDMLHMWKHTLSFELLQVILFSKDIPLPPVYNTTFICTAQVNLHHC